MDFSNNAFRAPPKVSEDTMSHANLVMACQWGWTSTPDSEHAQPATSTAPHPTPTTPFNNIAANALHHVKAGSIISCSAHIVSGRI